MLIKGYAAGAIPPLLNIPINYRRVMQVHSEYLGSHYDLGPYAFGKYIYHERQLSQFLAGKIYEVTPVTVSLSPSWVCNNACEFCTFGDRKFSLEERQVKGLMPKETAKSIIDQLAQFGIKGIIFTGGGEPTVHPNLIELMLYAKKRGLETALFTNGTFDPSLVEPLLRDVKPRFVRVSLNAADEATHFKMTADDPDDLSKYERSRSNFEKVVENLRRLAVYKYEHRDKVATRLGIGVIIGKKNVGSLSGFAERIDPSGHRSSGLLFDILYQGGRPAGVLDYIAFRPQVLYGGARKKQHPKEIFDSANSQFWGSIIPGVARIPDFRAIYIDTRFAMVHNPQAKQFPYCLAHPWRSSVGLGRDGHPKVYLCDEHSGDPDFALGDLSRSNFQEIMGSKQRMQVIERLNNGLFAKKCPPTCVLSFANKALNDLAQYNLDTEARERLESLFSDLRGAGLKSFFSRLLGRSLSYPDVNFL